MTKARDIAAYDYFPGRNLVYNGAMQVHQRSTSVASITNGNYYTADRWLTLFTNTAGTWTQSIENDAPTGSGFRKSLKMLCTTAKTVVTTDLLGIAQKFEGQDLQRVRKGTSSAQPLTLSFWVKANVTGTYIVLLYDENNNRQVAAPYTINSSATWERKIVTFPADTTGAFANDNNTALWLFFHLAAGANLQSGSLQTTWATYNEANRAVGQVNVAASTNNYWQVTGFQFETGASDTPFEFKPYGQELRECQRYYYVHQTSQVSSASSLATAAYMTGQIVDGHVSFPVEMRVTPTLSASSGTSFYFVYRNSGTDDFSTLAMADSTNKGTGIRNFDNAEITAFTQGTAAKLFMNQGATGRFVAFSAEL